MSELSIVTIAFFATLAALGRAIMPHLADTITAWGNLPRNLPQNDIRPRDERSALPRSFKGAKAEDSNRCCTDITCDTDNQTSVREPFCSTGFPLALPAPTRG